MRALVVVALCSGLLVPAAALAQGRASSTDEINRALGVDNLGRRNLLPSTRGNGRQVAKPAPEPEGEWGDEPPPVVADDGPGIPDHDVDGTCGALSYSQSRAYCVRSEQVNYNLLKALWPRASLRAKRISIRNAMALMTTASYYDGLLTYLQAEMRNDQDAMDKAAPPRFSR